MRHPAAYVELVAPSIAEQTLDAVRLLLRGEHRPGDMAEALGTSRRTVERLLRAMERSDVPLEVRREGREAFYSIPSGTLDTWARRRRRNGG